MGTKFQARFSSLLIYQVAYEQEVKVKQPQARDNATFRPCCVG